jgi:hypothetical protein
VINNMVLPSTQLMLTLLLAHLLVFLVLYLTWLFIRHAQKKHHQQMAVNRVKNMPKLSHHHLESPINNKKSKLGLKPNKWDNVDHELPKKDLETEKDFVDESLKNIKSDSDLMFKHLEAVRESPSAEERISKLPNPQMVLDKSSHQELFEHHVNKIKDAIGRKGLNRRPQVILNAHLAAINQKLSNLDHPKGLLDSSNLDQLPEKLESKIKSDSDNTAYSLNHDPNNQIWQEKFSEDFEKIYQMTSKDLKKKPNFFSKIFSIFKKKKITEPDFETTHQHEAERKAVDLVIKISKQIEGDHPIPPMELDWIEANLQNVYQDIWSQRDKH